MVTASPASPSPAGAVRWYVPVIAGVFLGWAQIADMLVWKKNLLTELR